MSVPTMRWAVSSRAFADADSGHFLPNIPNPLPGLQIAIALVEALVEAIDDGKPSFNSRSRAGQSSGKPPGATKHNGLGAKGGTSEDVATIGSLAAVFWHDLTGFLAGRC